MNQLSVDPVTMALHELTGRLSQMANAARAAADDREDPDIRTRCELFLRTTEHLLRTARQILVMARAEEEAPTVDYDPLQAALRVAADYANLGMPLRVLVPQPQPSLVATGVAGRLETLMSLLLANALDHRIPEAPVEVTATRDGSSLQIQITNRQCASPTHSEPGVATCICGTIAGLVPASLSTEEVSGVLVTTVTIDTVMSGVQSLEVQLAS